MNNSVKKSDELTDWFIEVVGLKIIFPYYIYYKYAPDESRLVVLSYFDDCVYCYTYEELVKWFVDTVVNWFHVNFLGCAHWFIFIRISQLKDYSLPVE